MLKTRLSPKYIFILILALGVLYMLPLQSFLSSPSLGSFYSMIVADGGITAERGIEYGTHPRQKLDIYRPENDKQTGPVVMFIYGGSWREGERAIYGFVGAALANQGITTIIPDYRLYPEVMFPAFIEDAAKAYGWVNRNIASSPLNEQDKHRPIILMGHSAGAHIAALLTIDQHYLAKSNALMPRPAGLIGLAGPMAFDPTTDPTTKDVFANVVDANTARPITFDGQGMPPTLLIHGLEDKTVGLWNTRNFAKALIKTNVKTCKLEVPNIGHVGLILALSKPLRWRAPVLKTIIGFTREMTGDRSEESKTYLLIKFELGTSTLRRRMLPQRTNFLRYCPAVGRSPMSTFLPVLRTFSDSALR